MSKLKLALFAFVVVGLFSCTPPPPSKTGQIKKPTQSGYLKSEISQKELNNPQQYKKYHYRCRNIEKGATAYLTTYFPLWRESRLKENFGFYFQLDGGKAQPFDHLENRSLNRAGTRFEVRYRSYQPIEGQSVELKARENRSVYYKNARAWLECREG